MTSTAMQKIPTEPTSSGSLIVQGPIGSEDWKTYAQIANIIAKTDFVPKHLRGKPAEIMACILYGRDQGIPAMISLQEIYVVDGHPTMSAHLMSAKARANGHHIRRSVQRDEAGEIISVTAHGTRDDGTEDSVTWSLKDAERAGLSTNPKKENWQKYPRQMLWARAVSELCNTLFTDVFLGSIYTVDEVEEALNVNDAMDAEYKEVVAGDSPPPPGGDDDGTGGGTPATGAAEAAASAPPPDLVDAEISWADYEIPHGHHEGETLGEIAKSDPAWLWGAASYKRGEIGEAIGRYLDEFPNTPKVNPDIPGQENLL